MGAQNLSKISHVASELPGNLQFFEDPFAELKQVREAVGGCRYFSMRYDKPKQANQEAMEILNEFSSTRKAVVVLNMMALQSSRVIFNEESRVDIFAERVKVRGSENNE